MSTARTTGNFNLKREKFQKAIEHGISACGATITPEISEKLREVGRTAGEVKHQTYECCPLTIAGVTKMGRQINAETGEDLGPMPVELIPFKTVGARYIFTGAYDMMMRRQILDNTGASPILYDVIRIVD